MSNFARVTYSAPPTRKQLIARIKRGEVLKNSDAALAEDYGLGYTSRAMHDTGLFLVPKGMSAAVVMNKMRQQQ